MTAPSLSIVVPTHNRKELLAEMLFALGVQTHPLDDFEVIVVLDGCTDGTKEALAMLHPPYELRVVEQEQAGPSTARNKGASLARGKVLLFMDDDLLPPPQFVYEHMRLHKQTSDTLVLGRFLPAPSGKKKGWQLWEERVFEKHYRYMREGKRPPAGRRLYSGNFSVGRAQFLWSGGFDIRLQRAEDVELGFRLEKAGIKFVFNPQAAAVHRGYRSFLSWCKSAYLYGRTDVQLARDRGHGEVIPEIRLWYYRQPALARIAVEFFQGWSAALRAATLTLRVLASGLSALRLRKLAHACYSGIFKLQYWQGVGDELGGRKDFLLMVREGQRSMTATPVPLATRQDEAATPAEDPVAAGSHRDS